MHILEPKMNKSPLTTNQMACLIRDKDRALKCVILILVTQNTNWIRELSLRVVQNLIYKAVIALIISLMSPRSIIYISRNGVN